MKVEVDVPNTPYGLRGRKATLKKNVITSELRSCEPVWPSGKALGW